MRSPSLNLITRPVAAAVLAVLAGALGTAPFAAAPAGARPTKKAVVEEEPDPPAVYSDFEDAKYDAREQQKLILVVCLKPNDPHSVKLSKLIDDNSIYLNPKKVLVFKYRTSDDKRLNNFRRHFNITNEKLPIVILTDSFGDPIASKAGLMRQEEYTAWAQEKGGKDTVDIPPDGLFNIRAAGAMVVVKELTPLRQWTLVTGRKLTASLVEAKGNIGTFRTDDNDYVELDFNHLIEADKSYLGARLPGGGASFP